MGMRKKIAKGLLYSAAPKLTFAALHPQKAAMTKAATWALSNVSNVGARPRRQSSNLGIIGVGAAAIALPIGMLIGRHLGRNEDRLPGRPI